MTEIILNPSLNHAFECSECGKQLKRYLGMDRTAEQFYNEVIVECEEYKNE